MELRHLRYFCAVAEDGHVTRAADRLHVSQSALTQQIKALETELDVALLRRIGRGIELTEAGRAFWREAQLILDRVPAAKLVAQETARGLAGRLAIGMTETASFAPPVTDVLKQARERWPQVEFSLMQSRSHLLIAALEERRIDVAFMRSPALAAPSLQSWSFLNEGYVVVVPDFHPLAARQAITPGDLSTEALVLPQGRTGAGTMLTQITTAIADLGHSPKIVQQTPEYVMAINLAAAGFGLAVVPAVLCGLRRDGVVYRPLVTEPPLRSSIIVVARAADRPPVVTNFMALCHELAPSRQMGLEGSVA